MITTKKKGLSFLLMLILLQVAWPIEPVMSEETADPKGTSTTADSKKKNKGDVPRMRKGDEGLSGKMMEFIRRLFEGDPPDIDEKLIRDDL